MLQHQKILGGKANKPTPRNSKGLCEYGFIVKVLKCCVGELAWVFCHLQGQMILKRHLTCAH